MTIKIERMNELITAIREADVAYYKYDNPVLTDREYDTLYNELIELETVTGIQLSGSPTNKVPDVVLEELDEVQHTKPMLSAQKTKSIDEMIRFATGQPVLIGWKLDGLTLVIRYENGKLKQAVTRGAEGIKGEDVTHNVKVFANVPLQIPHLESFEVRGEGVASWANFEKINMGLEEPYTHPRGLAAGSTRKLDSGECKKRFLEFLAFEMVTSDNRYTYKHEQLQLLAQNGFTVVPHIPIEKDASTERIKEAINSFDPKDLPYPVDGLIIEYDDIAYGQSLGATGHHENRLLAYKWEDELYETIFEGVVLATTRTGMVSITGRFADVKIDGATVNHAFLHNLDIFERFKLGIGDSIRVYKANKIIPQIAENVTKSGNLRLPSECPCCGAKLIVKPTKNGTRFLHCDNPYCPAKLLMKFVHFCEKTRMNIEGLSESTLEKLIEHGWIKNFGDIYELDRYKDEIISSKGFGQKSYYRLQAAVDKSRHCTLNQFIAGLGIQKVGRTAGRILNRYFKGDWDSFEQAIKNHFDFTQLKDFGPTMRDNIYLWYADKGAERLWRPALEHITFEKENTNMINNTKNPFYGKTMVATGKLANYTRDSINMKLLSLGATPSNSVTKKTDYLIVGENAGSKLAKAQELGVTTLTEAEFEAMLSA